MNNHDKSAIDLSNKILQIFDDYPDILTICQGSEPGCRCLCCDVWMIRDSHNNIVWFSDSLVDILDYEVRDGEIKRVAE